MILHLVIKTHEMHGRCRRYNIKQNGRKFRDRQSDEKMMELVKNYTPLNRQ